MSVDIFDDTIIMDSVKTRK